MILLQNTTTNMHIRCFATRPSELHSLTLPPMDSSWSLIFVLVSVYIYELQLEGARVIKRKLSGKQQSRH